MRRHWDIVHKHLPFSTLGHPRHPRRTYAPVHTADPLEEEDVEELISFLLEEEEEEDSAEGLMRWPGGLSRQSTDVRMSVRTNLPLT
jgi:hypothetical protein